MIRLIFSLALTAQIQSPSCPTDFSREVTPILDVGESQFSKVGAGPQTETENGSFPSHPEAAIENMMNQLKEYDPKASASLSEEAQATSKANIDFLKMHERRLELQLEEIKRESQNLDDKEPSWRAFERQSLTSRYSRMLVAVRTVREFIEKRPDAPIPLFVEYVDFLNFIKPLHGGEIKHEDDKAKDEGQKTAQDAKPNTENRQASKRPPRLTERLLTQVRQNRSVQLPLEALIFNEVSQMVSLYEKALEAGRRIVSEAMAVKGENESVSTREARLARARVEAKQRITDYLYYGYQEIEANWPKRVSYLEGIYGNKDNASIFENLRKSRPIEFLYSYNAFQAFVNAGFASADFYKVAKESGARTDLSSPSFFLHLDPESSSHESRKGLLDQTRRFTLAALRQDYEFKKRAFEEKYGNLDAPLDPYLDVNQHPAQAVFLKEIGFTNQYEAYQQSLTRGDLDMNYLKSRDLSNKFKAPRLQLGTVSCQTCQAVDAMEYLMPTGPRLAAGVGYGWILTRMKGWDLVDNQLNYNLGRAGLPKTAEGLESLKNLMEEEMLGVSYDDMLAVLMTEPLPKEEVDQTYGPLYVGNDVNKLNQRDSSHYVIEEALFLGMTEPEYDQQLSRNRRGLYTLRYAYDALRGLTRTPLAGEEQVGNRVDFILNADPEVNRKSDEDITTETQRGVEFMASEGWRFKNKKLVWNSNALKEMINLELPPGIGIDTDMRRIDPGGRFIEIGPENPKSDHIFTVVGYTTAIDPNDPTDIDGNFKKKPVFIVRDSFATSAKTAAELDGTEAIHYYIDAIDLLTHISGSFSVTRLRAKSPTKLRTDYFFRPK